MRLLLLLWIPRNLWIFHRELLPKRARVRRYSPVVHLKRTWPLFTTIKAAWTGWSTHRPSLPQPAFREIWSCEKECRRTVEQDKYNSGIMMNSFEARRRNYGTSVKDTTWVPAGPMFRVRNTVWMNHWGSLGLYNCLVSIQAGLSMFFLSEKILRWERTFMGQLFTIHTVRFQIWKFDNKGLWKQISNLHWERSIFGRQWIVQRKGENIYERERSSLWNIKIKKVLYELVGAVVVPYRRGLHVYAEEVMELIKERNIRMLQIR